MIVLALGVVLLLVAIALVALALGSGSPSGVNRSLALLEAMTTAPAAAKAEVDRPFDQRVLVPLQQRLLAVGRRLTGAESSERLRRRLDHAGNPRDWTVDRIISLKVLAAVALLVVGLMLGVVLGAHPTIVVLLTVGGLVLGYFAPDLYLYQAAYDRNEQIARELPDAIDLLTISVESGLGFDGACQQVARNTTGPLSEEFARMLAEMQIGRTRTAALHGMAERTTVDEVKAFVGAMVQADAFGITVGRALRVQSSEIRVKRRQRAETKAQQVPVKITLPLIFCVLPCLFVAVMGPAGLTVLDSLSRR